MMKRIILPIILFFILILSGLANSFLPFLFQKSQFMFVSHWLLIFLILIGIFYDDDDNYFAILYGAVFGLMVDVIYTGIIGPYAFVYPFSLYILHLLKRILQTHFFVNLIISSFVIFITETLLFFIYSFIDIINIEYYQFLIDRFWATLLANLLFLVLIYYHSKRIILWVKQ